MPTPTTATILAPPADFEAAQYRFLARLKHLRSEVRAFRLFPSVTELSDLDDALEALSDEDHAAFKRWARPLMNAVLREASMTLDAAETWVRLAPLNVAMPKPSGFVLVPSASRESVEVFAYRCVGAGRFARVDTTRTAVLDAGDGVLAAASAWAREHRGEPCFFASDAVGLPRYDALLPIVRRSMTMLLAERC
jgi:hypothetical protein